MGSEMCIRDRCVCTPRYMSRQAYVQVRRQPWVSVPGFHLVQGKVSLLFTTAYSRPAGPQTTRNSPTSPSYLMVKHRSASLVTVGHWDLPPSTIEHRDPPPMSLQNTGIHLPCHCRTQGSTSPGTVGTLARTFLVTFRTQDSLSFHPDYMYGLHI